MHMKLFEKMEKGHFGCETGDVWGLGQKYMNSTQKRAGFRQTSHTTGYLTKKTRRVSKRTENITIVSGVIIENGNGQLNDGQYNFMK